MLDYIYNVSPVDGRYRELTETVREYFSEYYLIKNRIIVEIKWLKKLSEIKILNFNERELKVLDRIVEEFDLNEAKKVKEIEDVTKHDVKAIEYYLNQKFEQNHIEKYNNFIHFACTSEDINNLAYGIMVNELIKNVYIPNISDLINLLKKKSNEYANISMLSHTHGQNATPTTVRKRICDFYL